LLDRIDIHIEVPRVAYEKLTDQRLGKPSERIRARVEAARQRQRERFKQFENNILCNADIHPAKVRKFCNLDDTGRTLMCTVMSQLQLSARAYHHILKLAISSPTWLGVRISSHRTQHQAFTILQGARKAYCIKHQTFLCYT
jgi:magnesium chelatase family protein